MLNNTLIANYSYSGIINTIRYGSMILLILGTFCNVAVIVTFCMKGLRQSKLTPYFICLAFVDLTILWIHFPRHICFTYNFQTLNGDKLYTYSVVDGIAYCLSTFSSWLNVVISMERMLAVYRPFTRLHSSTKYKPYMSMLLTLISVSVIHIITAILFKDRKYLLQISFFTYAFLPGFFIFASSVGIIYKILARTYLGQQLQCNQPIRSRNSIHIVVSLNLLFLLTTFPACIYGFVLSNKYPGYDNKLPVVVLMNTVALTNHCFNFVCYIVSSKAYRENLKNVCFRKAVRKTDPVFTLINRKSKLYISSDT